jgi:serine/threonine-protein kinase
MMSQGNTLTKEALGSVHYISPEQAKGGRVDHRSDLYSLGVVMYEMMSGRPPYDGDSPVSVAIKHINGGAVMPSLLNPNIPGGLEQIIMKAMAHEPTDRYETAAQMLADMDEFRKDPAILFGYNNPITDVDAATKLKPHSTDNQNTAPLPPKPVTDRTGGSNPAPRPRPVQQPGQPVRKPAARRPREEIVEDEPERGSKVATIAIVFCAVVAVIAIAVCIFAITNGAKNNMISVPSLVGMTEEQVMALPDIVIKVGDRRPSTKYPAGQVISQTPVAGSQIAKGGQITIVISTGSDVKTGVMADLTNALETDAINYLNGQNLGLQIVAKRENSSTVASGNIIRTEPAMGETLTAGQTVYLFISTGAEKRESNVPKVIGLDVQLARGQLNGKGFANIELEMVDSSEEKNTVVGIAGENGPILEGDLLDVTTTITLYLSNGKGDTVDPTDPTVPPLYDPDLVSTVVTVTLPQGKMEDYVLSIWQDGTLVEEIQLPADTISRDVELTGKGTMTFEFRIGQEVIDTVTIDFSNVTTTPPEA